MKDMNILTLIAKKRKGQTLSDCEIEGFVRGVVLGEIPDYQIASFLMAVCFAELSEDETLSLTLRMANSGKKLDLSGLPGVTADKHSTGGVGDKTTLIVAPLAAVCGLTVAKLSGRGLGFTGGTIDKLESIPGFVASYSTCDFLENVRKVGVSVAGQSAELVPADRILYALRDATGTVESIPLIAASIMSKKLAAGSECILLDVKYGSGAFMKTFTEAEKLAKTMSAIGRGAGRLCDAVLSPMDTPLGLAIGNSLEVAEALEVLKGRGPADLIECCVKLTVELLRLADLKVQGAFPACDTARRELVLRKLKDGSAYNKFMEMVEAQGGDVSCLEKGLALAKYRHVLLASRSGKITKLDAEVFGVAAGLLGAGRKHKDDKLDLSAGITLCKKLGDEAKAGEVIAKLYSSNEKLFGAANELLLEGIEIE